MLIAGSLFLYSGCQMPVSAPAAGEAYTDGVLNATLTSNYAAVLTATNKAFDQLHFAKAEEKRDAVSNTLTTHTPAGDQVEVVVTKIDESSIKVGIHVGSFGDESLSMMVLDKIREDL